MQKTIVVLGFVLCFLVACGGTGVGGGTPRTAVPAELTGGWYEGSVTTTNFYDPNTGSWGSPSGTGTAFTFNADGSFIYYQLDQVSLYGCTTSVFGYYTGTVTIEASALTLYANEGTVKYEDTCGETTEKPIDPKAYAYTWAVGPDESGNETLFLTPQGGSASAFHRD